MVCRWVQTEISIWVKETKSNWHIKLSFNLFCERILKRHSKYFPSCYFRLWWQGSFIIIPLKDLSIFISSALLLLPAEYLVTDGYIWPQVKKKKSWTQRTFCAATLGNLSPLFLCSEWVSALTPGLNRWRWQHSCSFGELVVSWHGLRPDGSAEQIAIC